MRIRTGYSFRCAAGSLPAVADRLEEVGHPFAITDRASTFGWVSWERIAVERGMKPIFGVELAVSHDIHAKRPSANYWTFLAEGDVGAVNRLVDLATTQFRYQPLLTCEQAWAAEGVIKIVGPWEDMESIRPREDLYVGLSPGLSVGAAMAAKEAGHWFADCQNNFYPRAEDQGMWEVICGRNASTQSYPQHILDPDEWNLEIKRAGLSDLPINVASHPEDGCSASLRKAHLIEPPRPKPLRKMCEEGAEELGVDLSDLTYLGRLNKELALIKEKDFEDYFYLVADICQWARSRMLVGPARGSSCGSLVCYLLGITSVDPIPHGLIFERFIDVNRDDLPDIDIDFSDQQRHLVFKYIAKKYGPEHVARLGTVAMYQPKSALGEAGAALKVPKWMCDAVAESLIERSSGDSRALNTLEDTLATMPAGQDLIAKYPEMAVTAAMEGHPRHYSQHSAGVVVSREPVTDIVAIDHRSGATMCNKKDAEELNLLKIDALGLTQLSIFEDCLELAGIKDLKFLEKLPLDDPEAFEVLNRGHFSGIFQFNGMALQSITKQFRVTCFEDIVSVTALGRPGPLSSGGAHEWIRRKNGINPVTYPHPIFESHLEDTLGIVLYQEQVMNIGRDIGGLDWGQVTALRKAMSKSLGKEYFDQFGDPWKAGAIAKGVNPQDAEKVWDDLCAYGAWSFNKSHSVAYGLISYWCCWLKAHYTKEFAAATLTHMGEPARQIQVLRELAEEGIDYVPIDPERSEAKWTVSGGKLIGPLTNVKGIGPKIQQMILGARARGERMPDRCEKLLNGAKTEIDSLWPIRDGFERLLPDPAARNIHTPPTPVSEVQIGSGDQRHVVFVTLSKINPRDENEAVIVARRGHEITSGPTTSLNLQLTDDTDTIFGKITRWNYARLGRHIVQRGKVGKALYAVAGVIRGDTSFRMLLIENIRYIGDL